MTIYQSPWPAIEEFSDQTTWNFLFNGPVPCDLSKVALIDAVTGKETTFGELKDEALRFAAGLSGQGLGRGDTILIFSHNATIYPTLLLATQAAGITASTANMAYTPTELAHQLQCAKVKLVFASSDLLRVTKEAIQLLHLGEQMVYVLPGVDGIVKTRGCNSYEKLRGDAGFKPVKLLKADIRSDIAILPFSSGTTSAAKGVELSHYNLTSCYLQLSRIPRLFDRPLTVVGALPLSHIYGLIVVLYTNLVNGGTLVLLPKFDLVKYCEAVQRYKATAGLIVPPIALGLVKNPVVKNYDLSSLDYIISGAAPLSSELQVMLENHFKGRINVVQGWGMTETTSIGLLPDRDDLRHGTCGKLVANMEARLVDEDGRDVPIGQAGELWVRGPNVMIGYHGNSKATRDTMSTDGWMMTGDVCVRSKDGHFTIVDRRKELIKYKGFQVIPSELEAILLTCPQVADAAVIGVWSEDQATELPRGYVVVEAKYAEDKNVSKTISNFVSSKVAAYKRLRGGVIVVQVIPKSPSGKILRKELRTLAASESASKARL